MTIKILSTELSSQPKLLYNATNPTVGCRYINIINRSPNEIQISINGKDFSPTNTITILPNSQFVFDFLSIVDTTIQQIYGRCFASEPAPISCIFIEL